MSDSVNLDNLREMTDGDKEIENILFAEFIQSCQAGIATLEENCTDGPNEKWRSTAHAIKGITVNLGAEKLGQLFKDAQEKCDVPLSEKETLLLAIKDEFKIVKEFLETLH